MTQETLLLVGDFRLLAKEYWMENTVFQCSFFYLLVISDERFNSRSLSPFINTCQLDIMSAWLTLQGVFR